MAFDLRALPATSLALSEAFCRMAGEACAVCLEAQNHRPGVKLRVRGVSSAEVSLDWQPGSGEVRDTYADPEVATECGAIAIAIMTVHAFTDYTIIRRSMKGTGFDYWLSRDNARPYRDDARLEISGLRAATDRQIRARARQKTRQTNRSDGALPAWISIVEFSRPVSLLQRKDDQ
jgi:hypothetical protein